MHPVVFLRFPKGVPLRTKEFKEKRCLKRSKIPIMNMFGKGVAFLDTDRVRIGEKKFMESSFEIWYDGNTEKGGLGA